MKRLMVIAVVLVTGCGGGNDLSSDVNGKLYSIPVSCHDSVDTSKSWTNQLDLYTNSCAYSKKISTLDGRNTSAITFRLLDTSSTICMDIEIYNAYNSGTYDADIKATVPSNTNNYITIKGKCTIDVSGTIFNSTTAGSFTAYMECRDVQQMELIAYGTGALCDIPRTKIEFPNCGMDN